MPRCQKLAAMALMNNVSNSVLLWLKGAHSVVVLCPSPGVIRWKAGRPKDEKQEGDQNAGCFATIKHTHRLIH